jgi:hypothetical protein
MENKKVQYKVKDNLFKVFRLPDNYPIPNLTETLVSCFLFNAEQVNKHELKEYNPEPGENEYEALELLNKGYDVYMGSFSSDSDDSLEALLCNISLNYTSEDKSIIIIHDGGY